MSISGSSIENKKLRKQNMTFFLHSKVKECKNKIIVLLHKHKWAGQESIIKKTDDLSIDACPVSILTTRKNKLKRNLQSDIESLSRCYINDTSVIHIEIK